MPRIKVKLLTEDCKPEKTHRWDAGWDLKALKDTMIPAGGIGKVHTGVRIEIPPHYCGMIVPRSSMGTKHRITLANDIGIIDSDYRGELMVFLVNNSDTDYTVEKGQRFAQLVITAINNSDLWIVDRLSNTSRGDGGFGSTTPSNPCGEVSLGEDKPCVLPFEVKDEPLTKEEEALIPEVDLTVQAKEIAKQVDKKVLAEVAREAKLAALKELKPAEYVKLKASGKLFDEYPIATGDMKQDLGI